MIVSETKVTIGIHRMIVSETKVTNGIQYVLLITRPVIIEYAYNEGNLWVPNAPVLYITNKKPVIRETGFRRICI